MPASGPDERLSAFYDGELSAVERAEVERLLAEGPELRLELSRLSDLSQRLGELADDVPEFDLRPQLLRQIMGNGRAASPVPLMAAAGGTRRRWMPLLLAACSLTLLVAAMLPLIPRSNQTDTVAMNSPKVHSANWSETKISESTDSAGHSVAMSAGGPPSATLVSDAPVAAAMSAGGFGGAVGGPDSELEEDGNADGDGPSELLVQLERNRKLKPGAIVSQMIQSGDVPMLIEYIVVDVDRSAQRVEVLLKQHQIEQLVPTNQADDPQPGSQPPKDMLASTMRAFVIEAEVESFNTAMLECSNLQEVLTVNVEPLGMRVTEGAQLAAENLMAQRAVEVNNDGDSLDAPEEAASAEKAPSIDRRAGFNDDESAPDQSVADEVQLTQKNQKKMSAEPDVDSAGSLPPASAEPRDQAPSQSKRKSAASINGYSVAIENGEEMYAELQQRQTQQPKTSFQDSAASQDLLAKNTPFAPPDAKQNSAAESTMLNGLLAQGRGSKFNNGLQYGNSISGGRNRLRAFIVLRPQAITPPPPPASSPIQP